MSRKIWWSILFESPWYSLIASFISFNLIWGLHTVSTDQIGCTTFHLCETPLKVYGSVKRVPIVGTK